MKGTGQMENIVIIETDECIGCESCVKICPDIISSILPLNMQGVKK